MSCSDVQTIQAGNGSTTQFSFDFPYLFKSEIQVSFWNATTKEWDVKATTDPTYPWQVTDANPTIVEFTGTPPPAPATPVDPNETTVDNVRIRRVTNIDDIRALFNPGSAIRSDDLNKNFEQLRYAIQEANCQGISDDVYQYLLDNYWDRFDNTLYSADAWVSDDTKIATTAAMDQRFQDEVNDTYTKAELAANGNVMPNNDDAVPTTGALNDYINEVITNDIGTDGTGITVTDDGDGTITLGLGSGLIDLDRIKASDIITSAEANPNNDNTIATTAKIDDMIDAAITSDIGTDGTGVTITNDGDGTITLGIGANSVDLDRIKSSDIITYAEQDAGSPAPADSNIFTASAAARRFDTLVQTATPSGSDWEVGKTWLQNDDDLTVSIWNGTGWTAVSSGGAFTEQPSVVYVDQASGDDNNTGHRISTPKATIKAAINQINEDIDISLANGGSGYVQGTYTNVPLTGGTGTGLTATIVVNASGVVSSVTLTSTTPLVNTYNIGDVLSASAANLGGTGSGLVINVTGDGDGQIVVVSAGVYQEIAPIQIKRRNVSIIGQALRSCIVHPTPATETNNLFELNSGSYLSSMTFTGVKAGSGTGNALDSTLPVTQGWNAAFYSGAYITKSPYIQNCTNFSDSEINNSDLNAHNPAGGAAGDTDSAPTGGGLLVNGATVASNSPLRSMVCDSYTHVALNGPGILVTNNGYAQCTSSYAFFNKYHIKCLNGGQANLAASTTDFGDEALVADGKSPTNIFTAALSTSANDGDITFTIDAPVADASWHGTATRPQGNMLVELNSIIYPVLSATANGAGWDVTISRPNPTKRSENLGLNGAVSTPATASFYLRSQVASSGHTMEYVGSGTNYSALPENGGVPDDTKQIVESNYGKVWTAITDQNGKFKIGDFFEVDQRTGFINFSAGSYAFDVVTDITPQLGGELDALTNKIVNLGTPTAANDAATKDYVDIAISGVSGVTSVDVVGGTGLTSSGGPITSSGTITVDLDNTAVTPGSYTYTSLTVDQQGRLTAASNGTTPVVPADIGVTVQAYDANLPAGNTILVDGDVGVTVQAYDANLPAGNTILVDSDVGVTVQAYDADTAKLDVSQTWSGIQSFNESVKLLSQKEVQFADSDNSNYVGFKSPATVSNNTIWTLPGSDGTSGQVLTTNGSKTLNWSSVQAGIQSFTSSGSITAGSAVQINGDGTVSIPSVITTPTAGAVGTYTSSTTTSISTLVYNETTDRYVATYYYNSYWHVVLGTPNSAGDISWGSPTQLSYVPYQYAVGMLSIPGTDKVVACYNYPNSGVYWWVLTVGSTSITATSTTGTSWGSGNNFRYYVNWNPTLQKIVFAWTTSTYQPAVLVGTLTGTTITWGTQYTNTGQSGYEACISYDPVSDKHILTYRGNSNYAYANVITVNSNSTITAGSDQLLSTADQPYYAHVVYSPAINSHVILLGDKVSTLTINGNTLTRGTTTTVTAYGYSSCLFVDPNSGRLLIHSYNSAGNGYPVLYYPTLSGGVFTLGSATILTSTNMFNPSSSPDRNILTADTSRSRIAFTGTNKSLTVSASTTSLTVNNFVGFAQSTVSTGQPVNVACVGGTDNNQSGLSVGSFYYVSGGGSLTTSVTTIRAGLALSTTKILVNN